MWVHPDHVQSQQWTTATNKKSKGKTRISSCNVVCTSSREAQTDVTSLRNSEEERIVLAAEQDTPLVAGTRSAQQYSKKYDEVVASSSKPANELANQPKKQPVKKQKELQYAKAVLKDKAEGSSTPYHFDVLG